jgi:oligopeptide transport system substrate-binding protein
MLFSALSVNVKGKKKMTIQTRRLLGTALLLGSLLTGASQALAEAVLHRGNAGEPQTLDYAHISIDIEGFVVRDMFEGLTIYDAKGKIVPGTAESWTISDDETVYTFKIRDNANWSDGSPVTAEDFVFAMRRLEDPKTAAEYANILYPIKNAEKANKGEVPIDQLGIKAVDAKTVEITLDSSCSSLPTTPRCRSARRTSRSSATSSSSRATW